MITPCEPFQHDNVDESPLKQDVSEHNELMTKSCCTSKDNKVGDKKQSLDMVCAATSAIY